MQRPFTSHWAIVVILILAVAVRLYGVGWGLPQVYEEARPMKIAWQMWGWGPDESFDLNPHFFNYPSLSIYTQFGGQAALYAGMRVFRAVSSTDEFRLAYHTAPTPFYVLGRLINVLFGALTVLFVYRLAFSRGTGGRMVALIASVLLAVNLFHVERTQMIEVDVPLTFFVVLTLALLLSMVDAPTRARYILAGVAAGLAAATKYTGALLLLPVVAAHLLNRRHEDKRAEWSWLFLALAAFAATFLLASPFVAADFPAFWKDLATEGRHMRLGHFGVGDQPAWMFYLGAVGNRLAGWPVLVLAAVGFVFSVFVRREKWAVIVAAFAVPYALAISSWAMVADRYALPLLPLLFVYAAAGLRYAVGLVPDRAGWRKGAAVAAVVVLAAPIVWALPRHLDRYEQDSRTRCLAWLEGNVPAGSFVVSETYGPPLEGPVEFWKWPGDLRDRIYAAPAREGRSFYSYLEIPMFQVESDQAAAFYDLRLYREADVLITTGSVQSRYLQSPDRFPEQVSFYGRLRTEFEETERFEASGTGPSIVVYRRQPGRPPFSRRTVGPPPALRPPGALRSHWHGSYYYRAAVNYEAWNHMPQAIAGYEMALPFTQGDSEVYREVVFGMTRCLALTGGRERALEFIEQIKTQAPTQSDLEYVEQLHSRASNYGR
jgi:4-amino-4-deoxy-L-arabinose transferase-like glycosyltransferase